MDEPEASRPHCQSPAASADELGRAPDATRSGSRAPPDLAPAARHRAHEEIGDRCMRTSRSRRANRLGRELGRARHWQCSAIDCSRGRCGSVSATPTQPRRRRRDLARLPPRLDPSRRGRSRAHSRVRSEGASSRRTSYHLPRPPRRPSRQRHSPVEDLGCPLSGTSSRAMRAPSHVEVLTRARSPSEIEVNQMRALTPQRVTLRDGGGVAPAATRARVSMRPRSRARRREAAAARELRARTCSRASASTRGPMGSRRARDAPESRR